MADMDDHLHDGDVHEDAFTEMYCVRCRETVMVDDPTPVWTRKGLPATRATCPQCGSTVFRLGKTALHSKSQRPSAVRVASGSSAELAQEAIYVNFTSEDELVARRIAADLQRIGLACWLHEAEPDSVEWAGGVHPALKECSKMVLVLSPSAQHEPSVVQAWTYFREKNKDVIIAQVAPADPPDALRRRPRFDFSTDYIAAFRKMVQTLGD